MEIGWNTLVPRHLLINMQSVTSLSLPQARLIRMPIGVAKRWRKEVKVATSSLQGCRLLVVEDDYLLAIDLCYELAGAGAVIVGKAANVGDALALLDANEHIDGAILDVNLGSEQVFPVADRLEARHVPFMFATAYDEGYIPQRYKAIARCEKPIDIDRIVRELGAITRN